MMDGGQWCTGQVDVSSFSQPGSLPCVARISAEEYEQSHSAPDFGSLFLWKVVTEAKVEATVDEGDEEEKLVIPLKHPGGCFELEMKICCEFSISACGWWQVLRKRGPSEALVEYGTLHDVVVARRDYCLTASSVDAYCLTRHSVTGRALYVRTSVAAHELLQVQGTCLERSLNRKGGAVHSLLQCSILRSSRFLRRFLFAQCIDCKGQELLLPLRARGPFLKVGRTVGATEHDAVYQIRDVVSSEQLGRVDLRLKPITGQGKKRIESVWLDNAYAEDSVLACTTSEPAMLIEFPCDSEIKFQVSSDSCALVECIHSAEDFCKRSLLSYYSSIKVLQNVAPSHQQDSPRKAKVKAKRSFLMRNRDLPPLPQKVNMRKKSKWETLKYHKEKLFSQIQRSTVSLREFNDPDYEKIPFYNRPRPHSSEESSPRAIGHENSASCSEPSSPCVPRKSIGQFQSDEDGYLLPSEARQLVKDYRDDLQRRSSCSEEEPIYCNEPYHRQSKAFEECMDQIIFNEDYEDEGIDCQVLDSFLMETVETLEDKMSKTEEGGGGRTHEVWEELETEGKVEEFLSVIFGACDDALHDSVLEDSECTFAKDLTETDGAVKDCDRNVHTGKGYRLTVYLEEAQTSF
ncbi:hypothetical protein CAPTEDRAFT_224131 [Capitella teleta]|uniref:Uncharacterized protein n=1 Tax=Capitella teleta TaxID=283909 RepID=R7TCB5_CAPTE|nr:hypothetical protein CAPTEDRAFT_224131 [Capitella teleta]|eukprot:ELT91334.1 hypothetical protein CAPTEDRAFT_224131 [Capitella teleta]